jgi:AAHS family 4-hydroxybenzoate transporter-like MFS transporter
MDGTPQMGEAIIDVTTEILDRQSLTSTFNARLLLLTFLVTLTYGFECSPTILLGPYMRQGWDESVTEFALEMMRSVAVGILIPPILGYLADRFGRRPVIVGTAVAYGLVALAAVITLRLVPVPRGQAAAWSGLISIALGSVLPVLVSFINEFAPRRARATMVVLVLSGIGLGGGLRMLLLSQLMQSYGPQTLLWFATLGPLAIALMLWATLPESVRYLALHPERRDDLAALLKRIDPTCQASADARFVMSGERNESGFSIAAVFAGRLALLTPLYWMLGFAILMVFSSFAELGPLLLVGAGLPSDQLPIGFMLLQVGGALGALCMMRFIDKFGFWPLPVLLACAIPLVLGIDHDGGANGTLVGAAWVCLVAALFGNFATAANVYPTSLRAFGLGLSFAVARVGSGLYWLLDDADLRVYTDVWRPYAFAAAVLSVGLLAALLIVPRYRALQERS